MKSISRESQIARASNTAANELWDMIVIGGGATGIGTAVDAAARGYQVLLLEQADFGKGTSSRSTKLVHGGVRYLKQGNISLVREALQERALLLRLAPHVVRDLPFIIPCPSRWQAFFYGTGLKLYDLLAGKNNLSPSRRLSQTEVLTRIPTLDQRQCVAGVLYHDGQFDDARLLINLAQTAIEQGACLINYGQVTSTLKSSAGRMAGVQWRDIESGREYQSHAKVVINATGPFCDAVRRMDQPQAPPLVAASQGVHLVLPKHFLPGDTAMMVPKTSDGRVVFLIPWHDSVVLGTTDTAIDSVSLEPRPEAHEIDFLLETIAAYLPHAPTHQDIQSVFTGIRPLVLAGAGRKTSSLSRDHTLQISDSGLITITGGKWTTYRRMAEDCVTRAAEVGNLPQRECTTRTLHLAGAPRLESTDKLPMNSVDQPAQLSNLKVYGEAAAGVWQLGESWPLGNVPLDTRLSITPAQVIWSVRYELARTVEDVLARRTRSLFLHSAAAAAVARQVAELMASELHRDTSWIDQQLAQLKDTARAFTV